MLLLQPLSMKLHKNPADDDDDNNDRVTVAVVVVVAAAVVVGEVDHTFL